MLLPTDMILIGRILKTHGLKGEVNLLTFTQDPHNIMQYGIVYLYSGRQLQVNGLRSVKSNKAVVKFADINSCEDADLLKNQEIFITRQQLPEINEADDEFYHSDLIGMTVQDSINQPIGCVVQLHNFGASDILEIETAEKKYCMIPFIEDAIQEVDLKTRIIRVNPEFIV